MLDGGLLSLAPRPPRGALAAPPPRLLGELLRDSSLAAGEPKMRSRASAYLRSFSARSLAARALRASKSAAAFLRCSSSESESSEARVRPAMLPLPLRERSWGVGLRARTVTAGLKGWRMGALLVWRKTGSGFSLLPSQYWVR